MNMQNLKASLAKFNRYSYSQAEYASVEDQIDLHNYNSCYFLLKIYVIAMGVFIFLCLIGVNRSYWPVYVSYDLAGLVLLFLNKKQLISERFGAYLTMALFLALSVSASATDPRHVATAYLVLSVLVAVLLTDNMFRMIGFYTVFFIVFSWSSFYFKGRYMWPLDSYNGLIYSIIGLALHYVVQRERVASFLVLNKYNEKQQELKIQASFDFLSGILTRPVLMELLQKMIDYRKCNCLYVGLVDIDHFKAINDQYGHQMGDAAIVALSRTVARHLDISFADRATYLDHLDLKKDNLLARLGGDEFIFVLHADSEEECRQKLTALQEDFYQQKIQLGDTELTNLHFSCGVVHYNNNLKDVDQVYQKADELMYQVKEAGGNSIKIGQS